VQQNEVVARLDGGRNTGRLLVGEVARVAYNTVDEDVVSSRTHLHVMVIIGLECEDVAANEELREVFGDRA
jgi:hypothetical protein